MAGGCTVSSDKGSKTPAADQRPEPGKTLPVAQRRAVLPCRGWAPHCRGSALPNKGSAQQRRDLSPAAVARARETERVVPARMLPAMTVPQPLRQPITARSELAPTNRELVHSSAPTMRSIANEKRTCSLFRGSHQQSSGRTESTWCPYHDRRRVCWPSARSIGAAGIVTNAGGRGQ